MSVARRAREGGRAIRARRGVGSALVKSGRVAKTIAAKAASGEFDLIVIGSRSRRGLRRFFFRSIPEQVVNSSPVSAPVVRSEVGG
jgi:nucleotide-binding universal stress UspA family protein